MDTLSSPSFLYNLSLYLTALSGALLAALWISMIFWTNRDIRSRTRDRLVQILASVLVGVLFLPGLLVYLILRPSETMDQSYLKTIEEEALLASIEKHHNCPGCGAAVNEAWYYCPLCYTRLGKECADCGRKMEISWQLCPFCGTAVQGSRASIRQPEEVNTEPSPEENGDTPAPQAPRIADY